MPGQRLINMERYRSSLPFLLAVAVGVLAALLKFAPSSLLLNMVSCAHKLNNTDPDAFLNRDVLPTNVRPVHYDLVITPDMTNFKFDGHVSIQ